MLKTLGGARLGSGNKMKVALHNYERSTHNLGNAWRSSMSPGVLVPFYKKLALNGDTWTIDTNVLLHTAPAIGPLFGSYKLQLDFFAAPIRLYQGLLHNNWTKIGMNMAKIKFPCLELNTTWHNPAKIAQSWGEQQQIHPSSLLRYLGIKGVGSVINPTANVTGLTRIFDNAIPILAYYDIFKNFYANKQEEYAYVIQNELKIEDGKFLSGRINWYASAAQAASIQFEQPIPADNNNTSNTMQQNMTYWNGVQMTGVRFWAWKQMTLELQGNIVIDENTTPLELILEADDGTLTYVPCTQTNRLPVSNNTDGTITIFNTVDNTAAFFYDKIIAITYTPMDSLNAIPRLAPFKLENIDTMRMEILQNTNTLGIAYDIGSYQQLPYMAITEHATINGNSVSMNKFPMQGLCVKTYQSDVLNNWLSKEWIDGVNGINNITAVDTSAGYFTIDALTLAKKMYNLLNRVAVSGGSYQDWQEAVYGEDSTRMSETPVYYGGMSGIIAFEEIVSTADTETRAAGDQPLGSLAGKGVLTGMKGGHIEIHVKEPSYIIGIASITPYIDYCEGNDFDMTEISTPNDFHKPELDGIGFQNLMLERATWVGKTWDEANAIWRDNVVGKQPAWVEYMTSKNEVYGDFADPLKLGHMVLVRRYDNHAARYNGTNQIIPVSDFTTYIDPTKYNYIFADTNLETQNFWLQIGINAVARRKMSAKIMPNL